MLAELRRGQGRLDEAEILARDSLVRDRRVAGDQPAIVESVRVLAEVYRSQGRDEAARPLLEELLDLRREAAERPGAGPRVKDGYARDLLTWEPADLRDPQTALEFALQANELSDFEDPQYLDTLALAYLLTGDAPMAIETQRQAISLLPEGDPRQDGFRKRLSRFEASMPGGIGMDAPSE